MRNVCSKLPGMVLLVVLAGPVLAETEQRQAADFARVWFGLPGTLTLEQGDEFQVQVEADPDDLQRIETSVRGDTLNIRWKEGLFGMLGGEPHGEGIQVRVVLPALQGLELAGSGDVHGGSWLAESFTLEVKGSGQTRFDEIAAEEFVVELAGSGDVDVPKVDAAVVRIELMGSGDVSLAGVADRQSIEVMGSGDVEASELEGARVEVEIMGSGDVQVWAQENLSARIMGSGDVRYRGSPRVDNREHGSGRVRAL